MRMIVALAALALVAPAGFSASPRLAPAASFVAQKPVAVWCAKTEYDWLQHVGDASDANGTAVPGSSELYLSPIVCRSLRQRLDRKTVRLPTLGPSLLAIVHEAIHDRGEADEGKTDCAAAQTVPVVARRFFRFTATAPLNAAVAAYRAKQPPAYLAVC